VLHFVVFASRVVLVGLIQRTNLFLFILKLKMYDLEQDLNVINLIDSLFDIMLFTRLFYNFVSLD
jgi:hypothetical protein